MGFSQGGLFLRYYAQYCNAPPIRNLITFGTPHYGISALIPCPTPPTVSCLLAARAARSGIYSSWAQTHLVQAAYFRDPARLDEFAEINSFVRDLNAEGKYLAGGRTEREEGGMVLRGLERFIAVMFDADRECILSIGCPGPPLSMQPRDTVVSSSPPAEGNFAGARSLQVPSRLPRARTFGPTRQRTRQNSSPYPSSDSTQKTG